MVIMNHMSAQRYAIAGSAQTAGGGTRCELAQHDTEYGPDIPKCVCALALLRRIEAGKNSHSKSTHI